MSSSIICCLFDTKENNNKYYMSVLLLIDQRLRYIGVKDFSTELNCKKSLNLIQYLEDDINYSSTVMFRGTPCSWMSMGHKSFALLTFTFFLKGYYNNYLEKLFALQQHQLYN